MSKKLNPPNYVLICLKDQQTAKTMARIIQDKYGDVKILALTQGDEAWNQIKSNHFDLIILDWKLAKVSGLVLFNRLRQYDMYKNVPILVISDAIFKEDFALLKDYPLSEFVDKQSTDNAIEVKLESLLQEADWFRSNNALLDQLSLNFKSAPDTSISNILKIVKNAPNPMPILNLAGRKFRELQMYSHAEKILKEALRLGKVNSSGALELAKVFHSTGRHREALQLIENSQFSLKNVERLLLVGEMNLAEKDPDEARTIFKEALSIDAHNQAAKSGLLLAENMKDFLGKNTPDMLPESFASMLNLVGISLIKAGRQNEGIAQYKAALAFLHDNVAQARLMYNIGLAYLRWGKERDAVEWFSESARRGGHNFLKGADYIDRLRPTAKRKSKGKKLEGRGKVINLPTRDAKNKKAS